MEYKKLTARQYELLDALHAAGGFVDRVELAQWSGKRALSPHDRILLIDLIDRGLVEVKEQPVPGSVRGKKSIYRMKQATLKVLPPAGKLLAKQNA